MASRPTDHKIQPRFNLEVYEAPRTLYHGESARLILAGWVATEPQVRTVHVKFSGEEELTAPCNVPRPDVLASFEEFSDELCGFNINADLQFLPPGLYHVEWLASDVSISKDLGSIHVLPGCEFSVQHCFIPDTATRFRPFPISLDIVNYDYIKLYPHATTVDVPQIMVVHEERLSARLASGVQEQDNEAGAIKHLDALLKDFYLSSVALPRKLPHMAALTEEDADALRRHQQMSRIYVNHIGVDTERLGRPQDMPPAEENRAPTFVFLGNYKHPPNVAAVRFFADEVMPGLRERCPQAEFLFVGSNVPAELQGREAENVLATGFVDDFRPYIWDASAFVAPIFSGAGMRVKILEAMACGAPIVGTRLSMHGIEAMGGEHYLRAETAAEFVDACCRCIESPEDAMRVGEQGADLIARQYSNEISARERELLWYSVIEQWRQ